VPRCHNSAETTMADSSHQRDVLIQSLADLIGFDDGVADVLEHLLTIESKDDLLDYLSQLLGSESEQVKALVQSISAFQQGETIDVPTAQQSDQVSTEEKGPLPTAAAKPNIAASKQAKASNKNPPDKEKKSSTVNARKTAPQTQAPMAQHKQPSGKIEPHKKKNPTPVEVSSVEKQRDASVSNGSQPVPKSKPPRGKAKFTCGCFGTFHKPLANCLFCGRVACEKEGYSYCPFCGYLIERPPPSGTKADKHKQRLLRFDREYAQRTVVLDDQADFFVETEQSLNWMDSEERQQKVEEQQEQLRQTQLRPKMRLEIDL